nr:unnamed protein product [Callosobruchus chinensis]
MSNIEIKHLFKHSRCNNTTFEDNRSFLCYAISYVIPETVPFRKFINKITCMALGIAVTVENPKAKENVGVFVSNNLSVFDHVAVQKVTNAVMPMKQCWNKL